MRYISCCRQRLGPICPHQLIRPLHHRHYPLPPLLPTSATLLDLRDLRPILPSVPRGDVPSKPILLKRDHIHHAVLDSDGPPAVRLDGSIGVWRGVKNFALVDEAPYRVDGNPACVRAREHLSPEDGRGGCWIGRALS